MHAQAKRLITGEEFFLMPESRWCELVYGELVPMPPVGESHGNFAGNVHLELKLFARAHDAGRVLVEAGYYLARDPDLVRAPDVSFVRRDRLVGPAESRYREGAPDLAVEVLSPGDTVLEMNEKVNEYLDFGTEEIWLVDPRQKQVQVIRKEGARTLRGDDVLEGQGPLAGFSVPVSRFFID